jgi:phospholipase D3/4
MNAVSTQREVDLPRAILVETMPDELYEIHLSRSTHDVLLALVEHAQHELAIAAMYWTLLPGTAGHDEDGLTPARLATLGAGRGERLLAALAAAAARGVQIRVVQSAGFAGRGATEAEQLAARFPEVMQVRAAAMGAWYGAGTMHQKFIIADRSHFYLGSANMDWRALSQVKELGVVVWDDPNSAAELQQHFEVWWQFAGLAPHPTVLPAAGYGVSRNVPAWSLLHENQSVSPIILPAAATWEEPLAVNWNGKRGTAFFAASPPALCGGGRMTEQDALLRMIAEAGERLDVSVMNFLPVGSLPLETGEVANWGWPALYDALLHAATRGTKVRLLASRWAHTGGIMERLLAALQAAAEAEAPGGLSVRMFTMPGWDQTEGPGRAYPGYSRVNHPKFAVTESRLHLTTSNMTWRDFYVNAGVTLNSDHPDLVRGAQAIFDRDWDSPNACEL